jgi:phosphatidate phosphatase APP1
MLANTFVRPFRPVPGMAELYRRLAAANATFHYVTGSPWQLYEPLRDFCRDAGFPRGSFHMKYFRLTDSSVLNIFGSQQEYKTRAIEEIVAALPGRRFVLVGDSGEQDPEVYGGIARNHPGQVAAIFIRNVTGETPKSDRFGKAFEGVPPDRWRLFDQPAELGPLVARLKS